MLRSHFNAFSLWRSRFSIFKRTFEQIRVFDGLRTWGSNNVIVQKQLTANTVCVIYYFQGIRVMILHLKKKYAVIHKAMNGKSLRKKFSWICPFGLTKRLELIHFCTKLRYPIRKLISYTGISSVSFQMPLRQH